MYAQRGFADAAVVIAVMCLMTTAVVAFNLSPRPNLVLREPQLPETVMAQPKTRSSYFGFTINMRRNSIIVGAPRAQSSLPQQSELNETGAIYRCPVLTADLSDTLCEPFVFEHAGNLPDGKASSLTFDGEMRDNQWLGASMDGGVEDTDQLVVCAPRMFTNAVYSRLDVQLNHGICYWTADTTAAEPTQPVAKIKPLILKENRLAKENGDDVYFYMLGEEGISVHVTDNGKEVLIGAPGVSNWKGTVIRFRQDEQHESGGMSRRSVSVATTDDYISQVPNPSLWAQPQYSYFGYAVSSGYFESDDQLLYVASAPQANQQQGEVYIFDIVDGVANSQTIRIHHTFASGQMGEYFGYSLVVDDFNGDNWPDLAVGAPFHSNDETSFENGVVYVFLNDRGIAFEAATVLRTDYTKSGRFGSALSKVGDVDGDGYNDLVVGAPYENDGAVYLFLGSADGLNKESSQRLVSSAPVGDTPSMFGHGLSKGSDIDGNYYPDLAVGAPNAESVFVFRAYPVGQIEASITPTRNSIGTADTLLGLRACWRLETKHAFEHSKNFGIEIQLDPQYNRISHEGRKTIIVNSTVSTTEECREFELVVQFISQYIFRPVTFDMHFEVLDTIPDSEEFCSTCIAINPTHPKVVRSKVAFSTGCLSDVCMADLRISSTVNTPLPFVLGSAKSISIDYSIRNTGEPAFLPQLIVRTSTPDLKYIRIPSECVHPTTGNGSELLCDLNQGSPLQMGDETTFRIHLDTSDLLGSEFRVHAETISTGDEANVTDNEVDNLVPLTEFSTIEVVGKSSKSLVSLEEDQQLVDVTHVFEIRNIGPSKVEKLDVVISIPSTYLDPWHLNPIEVIDFNGLSARAAYETRVFQVEFKQNNTLLVPNPLVHKAESSLIQLATLDQTASEEVTGEQSSRRRRALRDAQLALHSYRSYNRYTRSVQEFHQASLIESLRLKEDLDPFVASLPVNRTIFFDCSSMAFSCIQARFSVNNFKVSGDSIMVSVNFTVNLASMSSILTDDKEFLVLRTMATILKRGDLAGNTVSVVSASPYIVISKYLVSSTPIWVYIVSAVGGLIVLLLITYGMHKLGFFRRHKKEELDQFKRKSQALALQHDQELDD